MKISKTGSCFVEYASNINISVVSEETKALGTMDIHTIVVIAKTISLQ